MYLDALKQKLLVKSYIKTNLPFLNMVEDKYPPSLLYWQIKYDYRLYRINCLCERSYFSIDIFSLEEQSNPEYYTGAKEYGGFSQKCKNEMTSKGLESWTLERIWYECLLLQLSNFFDEDLKKYQSAHPTFRVKNFNEIFEEMQIIYNQLKLKERQEKKPWWRKLLDLY